jgi:predicted RNase H-like nuclease (RuvC/YqgF family)
MTFIAQIGNWAGIVAMVVVGIFVVIGIVDKKKKELKKEETDTASNVIDLLKEQVDALEGKVDKQENQILALTGEVTQLRAENKTLTEVLQGRDDKTQQFYKDCYAAIEMMKITNAASVENNKTSSYRSPP